MTTASRTTLVLLTAWSALRLASAQEVAAPPLRPPVHLWAGDSFDFVAGVNNGIRKLFTAVEFRRDEEPRIRFEGRATAPTKLRLEIFQPYRPPESLFYAGSRDVDEGGDQWREHRWVDRSDFAMLLLHPVRAVGPEGLAYFKRYRWDVTPERPPYAMVVLVTPTQRVYFPLRDLAGFALPKKALLLDRVPIERHADRAGLLADIREKLTRGTVVHRLEAIEQLGNFPTQELRGCASDLLALAAHEEPELARTARAFMRARSLPDREQIRSAESALGSPDPAAVAEALAVLVRTAPGAVDEALLRQVCARSDLPAKILEQARQLMRVGEARPAPADRP